MSETPDTASATQPLPAARALKDRIAVLRLHLARARRPIVIAATIGTVISGFLGYWNVYRAVSPSAPVTRASAQPAPPLSIVVLPFGNQTGDPQKDYVAGGLTTSITSDLLRIRDAFVVPVSTAVAYKDKTAPVKQVAEDLGVRFVLQGAVLASGNRLRINVQLADASTGAQQWTESFEGELTDLFALQDQVTRRVGNSIGEQMVILAARQSETRKSSATVADMMLRARALVMKTQSLQKWKDLEVLYRKVLAVEPENSRALSGLSIALLAQVVNFGSFIGNSGPQLIAEGGTLARKAQAIDPDDPSVYTALSVHAAVEGDRQSAVRYAARRVELLPRDPWALNDLSVHYRYDFQPAKAIAALDKALELYPKGGDTLFANLAECHFMLGNYDVAIAWAQRAVDTNTGLTGPYTILAMAHSKLGDDARAQRAAAEVRRRFPELKPPSPAEQDSEAMRQYVEATLLPAWKKAGLP